MVFHVKGGVDLARIDLGHYLDLSSVGSYLSGDVATAAPIALRLFQKDPPHSLQ